MSAGATQSATSGTDLTITLGNYAEQVFAFEDRFFLTGGLRYDGNSSFGKSFKGVFYPKIGAVVAHVGRELLPARRAG